MRLSEQIYRLRTERGFSQEDLANALDVSRQSVSKWETGSATPDLEKLMKLSALFDVSLDELVRGESKTTSDRQPQTEPQIVYVESQPPSMPPRKIIGFVCFGFAVFIMILCSLLGGFLAGLILSIPFISCGTICFLFQRRIALWCCWSLFFLLDIYLRFATGITWGSIRMLIQLFAYIGTVQWVISLILTILLVALICWTVYAFRDKTLPADHRRKRCLALLAIAFVLATILPRAISYFTLEVLFGGEPNYTILRLVHIFGSVMQWVKVPLFCLLIIDFVAIRRWKLTKASD